MGVDDDVASAMNDDDESAVADDADEEVRRQLRGWLREEQERRLC